MKEREKERKKKEPEKERHWRRKERGGKEITKGEI